LTNPDEQARSAFTAEDHTEFKAAATTSPHRFLKEKYGEDPTDYDTPSEFVAATAGKGDPSGPSHPNPDDVAEQAMTVNERVEYAASDYDSPAAFLKDRNGVSVASFDDPSEYQKAVAQANRGEQ
jgi:hypothetical protein